MAIFRWETKFSKALYAFVTVIDFGKNQIYGFCVQKLGFLRLNNLYDWREMAILRKETEFSKALRALVAVIYFAKK